MKKKVGILVGGMGSEREISLKTGAAFKKSVENLKFSFEVVDAGNDLAADLSRLKSEKKIDVALLALHGKYGEDGTVQGILEYLKIPYTGSGVLASALAINKVATKQILTHCEVPTAEWEVVDVKKVSAATFLPKSLALPVVVKPTHEGSSVGVTIVRRKDDFKKAFEVAGRYGSNVLVERYLDGMEVTVPIWFDRVLPIIEIIPAKGTEYDFNSKYTPGESEHVIPARLAAGVIKRCERFAMETFHALNCRHYARVDMRLDSDGNPFVLEINTLPGCTETSLFPESAMKVGITFDKFIETLIENAALDYG